MHSAWRIVNMFNLHIKQTEISQKRSKETKNCKRCYILSVLSNKTNLRPCHTRQFPLQLATQWRCIASCKEDFLVWHPMFATSLTTKNCVGSHRESRSSLYFSQCYATSCSVWHPHCNLSRNFLRRDQSQYNIIRMPLTFLNTRRA